MSLFVAGWLKGGQQLYPSAPPALVPDETRLADIAKRQHREQGYQDLERGVFGFGVDGDFGTRVDAQVSGAGFFGFFSGQPSLDDGLAVAQGSPP